MYAEIQPVPCFKVSATQLHAVAHVAPNQSASVEWTLADAEGKPLQSGLVSLDGDAYQAWGASDEYLFTWLASAIGVTIVEIKMPTPPAPYVPPAQEPALD